jgi:hypothetical protein
LKPEKASFRENTILEKPAGFQEKSSLTSCLGGVWTCHSPRRPNQFPTGIRGCLLFRKIEIRISVRVFKKKVSRWLKCLKIFKERPLAEPVENRPEFGSWEKVRSEGVIDIKISKGNLEQKFG